MVVVYRSRNHNIANRTGKIGFLTTRVPVKPKIISILHETSITKQNINKCTKLTIESHHRIVSDDIKGNTKKKYYLNYLHLDTYNYIYYGKTYVHHTPYS